MVAMPYPVRQLTWCATLTVLRPCAPRSHPAHRHAPHPGGVKSGEPMKALHPQSAHVVASKTLTQGPRTTLATMPCDFPKLNLSAWVAEHGEGAWPNYPAVFTAPDDAPFAMFKPWRDKNATQRFLHEFGECEVTAQRGYLQAGGHLGYVKGAEGAITCAAISMRLRELVESGWGGGGYYVSETFLPNHQHAGTPGARSGAEIGKCFGHRLARQIETAGVAIRTNVESTNVLVGGGGSGLPFHRHQRTWQMQLLGRKSWHLVPPGRLGGALADTVGPWIFPPSIWADRIRNLPLGQRPLSCVQQPGEIIAFPDDWWHATVNLDEVTLAYGRKPRSRAEPRQFPLEMRGEIMRACEQFTAVEPVISNANAPQCDPHSCGWYNILGQLNVEGTCTVMSLLNASLATMSNMARVNEDQRFRTTNAFAHCVLVERMQKALTQAKAEACVQDGSAQAMLRIWEHEVGQFITPRKCVQHCHLD